MKQDPIVLPDRLTRRYRKYQKEISVTLIFIGIIFPFLLLIFFDSYHRFDVGVFQKWAECWGDQVYLQCKYGSPNYPMAGLAMTAGIINAIKSTFNITDSKTLAYIFRYFLAIFDSLNFLLLVYLAKIIRLPLPIIFSLIVLMIPATWAGTAVWGQIDGVSLFFGLASAICIFQSWLFISSDNQQNNLGKPLIFWIAGTVLFSVYLLTKQLTIFSLPFFFLLSIITLIQFWTKLGYRGIIIVVIGLVISAFSFSYFDSFFPVAEEFNNSSYWFVWAGGGSEHGKKIAGNGFNMWIFLFRNQKASSVEPFFSLNIGGFTSSLSPYKVGIYLYCSFIAFLLFTGCRSGWQFLKKIIIAPRKDKLIYSIVPVLCFFHGLCHLSFNVFLTGTHERYLYLGYPFLLIAVTWFYSRKIGFSWYSTLFCFISSFIYGSFVYSRIGTLPSILFFLTEPKFLGIVHIFLLVVLSYHWLQVCNYYKNHSNLLLNSYE
ncbi:MAG: hypothetical protein AB4062_05260 [Crocosphaera sp.]